MPNPTRFGIAANDHVDLKSRVGEGIETATAQSFDAGRYRVERLLGEGGMGSVYQVWDETAGQRLALKLLSRHTVMLELFEREYRTLASLRHPGIVQVLEYGVDPQGAFYTMELLEGGDLSKRAPMPWREVCSCLRDSASTLGLLHARRLVHRDLNPRNLWLTPAGRLKLLDFGALAPFGKAVEVVGAPSFVAPEAMQGRALDQRTDLFALGALGYWLLTSTQAYQAARLGELERAWERTPGLASRLAPFVEGMSQDIPTELDRLIDSLLRLDAGERPNSTAEVIDQLNHIAGLKPEAEEVVVQGYLESSAFVGRERERDRFAVSLSNELQAKPAALLIEGPEGIGRSRLLAEFELTARVGGATVLRVRGEGSGKPYETAAQLARALLSARPRLAFEAAKPFASSLGSLSFELYQLLGAPAQEPSAGDAAEQRTRKQTALSEWFLKLAEQETLVLLVDDLHDVDEPSQAVLTTLARPSGKHRLLLVGAVVSESQGAQSATLRAYRNAARVLPLAPLSEEELRLLLRSVFGEVLYLERLCRRLHDVSGGSPTQALMIARHLVRTEVVRYAEGVWLLPAQLPDDLPTTLTAGLLASLHGLPPEQRRLAQLASMPDHGGLTRAILASLCDDSLSSIAAPLAALLSQRILIEAETGLKVAHPTLEQALWNELSAEQRARAHAKLARLLDPGSDAQLTIRKALHLLRAGDFAPAERLLLQAARRMLKTPSEDMRASAQLFAGAYALLTAAGRNDCAIVPAAGVLAMAGYLVDRSYAARYGDQAVELMRRVLRFDLAQRLTPFVGRKLALFVALAAASLGVRRSGTQLRVLEVVSWLVSTTVALSGTATTCIDPDKARKYAETLTPLLALGPDHLAALLHRFVVAMIAGVEDRPARAFELFRQVVARLVDPKPVKAMPEGYYRNFLGGAYFSVGIRQTFAADERALETASTLEALGPQAAMQADQLRALCFAIRGNHMRAAEHERRVDMQAIKLGTAWQVELWLPAQMLRMALWTNDAVLAKQATRALARLVSELPSLAPSERLARATYLVLRKKYEAALPLLEVEEEPLARIGWAGSRALLARVHNELGQYAKARTVCLDALERLAPEDLEFVIYTLNVQAELAVADAGLGKSADAERRLLQLLERHATKGALVLGWLHRTSARVAMLNGDHAGVEAALAAMEQHYRTTHIPSLAMLNVELRAELRRALRPHGELDAGAPDQESHFLTRVGIILSSQDKSADERTRLALGVALDFSGAEHGFILYGPDVQSTVALGDPPSDSVIGWAQQLLRDAEEDGGRTAVLSDHELVADRSVQNFGGVHYSLCILWRIEGPEERPVAALALASDAGLPGTLPGAALRLLGEHLGNCAASSPTLRHAVLPSRPPSGSQRPSYPAGTYRP